MSLDTDTLDFSELWPDSTSNDETHIHYNKDKDYTENQLQARNTLQQDLIADAAHHSLLKNLLSKNHEERALEWITLFWNRFNEIIQNIISISIDEWEKWLDSDRKEFLEELLYTEDIASLNRYHEVLNDLLQDPKDNKQAIETIKKYITFIEDKNKLWK